MLSETELFDRIKNGDKDAFESLFRQYYSSLCGFAAKFLRDPDAAEEIVQEFFVQLWQKKDSLTIISSLRSYLFRSVHNSCMNHLKRKSILKKHETIILGESREPLMHEPIEPEEDKTGQLVRSAIEKLPGERRKIFIMSRFDELSYREIAEKLGISVKTVENQMGKALKYLRDELKGKLFPVLIIISEIIIKISRGI